MAKIDATKIWSLNYRLVSEIIVGVAPQLAALHLETKELFVLAAIDEHPHPAALADTLCMPKPTVTLYLKRLVAANLVRREIDAGDLRRHRLNLTPAGRKVMLRGLALLTEALGARLSRLSAAEQTQLATLLEKLG
ncbi:MAG TPA: MarR family transcriptional regulator [Xanthobacteraceae bacterium]|jgi:DNA-binding MarR family transcriptional regulator